MPDTWAADLHSSIRRERRAITAALEDNSHHDKKGGGGRDATLFGSSGRWQCPLCPQAIEGWSKKQNLHDHWERMHQDEPCGTKNTGLVKLARCLWRSGGCVEAGARLLEGVRARPRPDSHWNPRRPVQPAGKVLMHHLKRSPSWARVRKNIRNKIFTETSHLSEYVDIELVALAARKA